MSKDKKQLLVVGILGLAMLAIGAFQFLAPKGPAAVAPEPEVASKSDGTEVASVDPVDQISQEEQMLIDLLGSVEPRDPFLAQAIIVKPPDRGGQQTPVGPKPPRPTGEITGGSGNEPWPPGNDGLIEGPPLVNTGEFAYKLKGVLVGASDNIAVFEDSNGNQKLVGVGDRFGSGSETEVISIDASGVTIRHRGKKMILSVEQG